MPSTTGPDKPALPQPPRPPMGELLALLRSSGFQVTTDDYVDLLKIVEHYGHEGLDSLALRICPIIAMTPEEQARFYNVFEGYKQTQLGQALPQPPPRRWSKWWRIIPGSILLAAACITAWMYRPGATCIGLPKDNGGEVTLALNEVYENSLAGSGMFAGRSPADMAYVEAVWEDIGRGEIGRGKRIRHLFKEPGLHKIRRTVSSTHFAVCNASDTLSLNVCGYLPRIAITAPGGTQPAKTPLTFTARPDTMSPALRGYTWRVDEIDSDFRTVAAAPFVYSFDTPGVHTIYCRADIPGNDYSCTRRSDTTVIVADTSRQYSITYRGDNVPFQLKSEIRWWPGLVALLLSIATAFWAFGGKKKKQPPPQTPPPSPPPPRKSGPPYEVPFSAVKAEDVIIDKPLRRFLQHLRLKAEEEITELDVPKSIRATIRNGGVSEAVLTPRRRIQDYLVFIDKTAPHGMMHALYLHLADVMEAEGISITRFVYDADFVCYNAAYPAGTSLRNIADNYAGSLPIILGDGKALLHPVAPAIKPALLNEILRWERCMLITPTPYSSWQPSAEGVLQRHLSIAPADASALERLGQELRSGTAGRSNAGLPVQLASVPANAFTTVDSVKEYLSQDEALFQWLCALCIYPKLRWELVVAFGRAILSRYGREGNLRYDMLLQLCRIPWMATGSFPQRLRLQMLKMLEVENEVAARAALVALLQDVDRRYPGDYVFSAEKSLQSLLSRFVLYANAPVSYPQHEGAVAELSQRLTAGTITDVPGRKYLEKADGDAYQTPVADSGTSVGIRQFIHVREERQKTNSDTAANAARRRRVNKALAGFGIIGLLAIMWSVLYFNAAARQSPTLQAFYITNPAQNVQLSYRVEKDFRECGDSSKDFRVMPGTLYIDGKPYGLSYNGKTKRLEASLPYADFAKEGAHYRMMLGIGGPAAPVTNVDTLRTTGVVTAKCAEYNPNDTIKGGVALPDVYNEIWQGIAYKNLISIDLDTRMIYYSNGDPKTYGSYRIDTVVKPGNDYQVVTQTQAFPGYTVFFIHDGGSGQIKLGVSDPYSDKESALEAKKFNVFFHPMTPYYEQTKNKIFLPVAPGGRASLPLRAEEAKKVLDFIYRTADASVFVVGYQLFRNPSFIRSYTDYDLKGQFKKQYPNLNTTLTNTRYMEAPNPFQRENLELEDISPRSSDQSDLPANEPVKSKPVPGNRVRSNPASKAPAKSNPALKRPAKSDQPVPIRQTQSNAPAKSSNQLNPAASKASGKAPGKAVQVDKTPEKPQEKMPQTQKKD